ncbi:MAG: hypothetical protein HKO66_10925 [Saprospiraceae bacterium]|nr:hypothetical protein [Bacteroidia bacterium]NNE14339.1 hypothetical protein [Saprospiraceae bacterium]NNL92738.1 hypothetical protein [Saprospiraceae bacterium]
MQKTLAICHSRIFREIQGITLIKRYIKLIVCSIGFILFTPSLSYSQSEFIGLSSIYDDSSREWRIYCLDNYGDEFQSYANAKWPHKTPWTEWQIDHLDYYWNMFLRFQTNPQHWFLDSNDLSISIKQKWRNDITEWSVSFDDHLLKWKSEYRNDLSVWFFESKEFGYLEMWTTFEGDPRDWEIEDQAPNVPDEVKVAMIMITAFQTNGIRQ